MKAVLPTGYAGLETHVILQGDDLVTGTVQDCTPILEDAKARHNAGLTGTSEMRHAARFPVEAVEAYCNTNGITFEEWTSNPVHLKRMLSDPALSGFRIWSGAV